MLLVIDLENKLPSEKDDASYGKMLDCKSRNDNDVSIDKDYKPY